MSKISRKLRNVLIVDGPRYKLNVLEKELKETWLNIVYVPCPEDIEELNNDFISEYWKVEKSKLYKIVICARDFDGRFIFAFNNSFYEEELLRLIEKYSLNAKYNYYINLGDMFVINKESIIEGNTISTSESLSFPKCEFSIAKCLV